MNLRETKGWHWYLTQLDPQHRQASDRLLAEKTAALAALPAGPDRARAIHEEVSALQADFLRRRPDLAEQIQCRRGCGHCCHMWVGVTLEEADLLADRVVREGIPVDRTRLALQATLPDPSAFFTLPRPMARCVFLDPDGACRVHEDRPSTCRNLLVSTPPEACRTGGAGTRIEAIVAPEAEMLASAALSAEADQGGRHGHSLPRALLAALRSRTHL